MICCTFAQLSVAQLANRLFQPLLSCTKEGRRSTTHSGPASSEPLPLTKGSSRCWRWRLLCLRFEWETGSSLSTWRMPIFTFRLSGGTGSSFGLLLEGMLTNTRFFPLAWPWRRGRSQNAWMLLWPLWGSRAFRVLNYLDAWLILAYSRELVSCHRDIVLRHIHALGLRTNTKKSVLSPSRKTVFLGVHLDSVQMQARLAPAQIYSFNACLARFKLGHHVSVSTCCRS